MAICALYKRSLAFWILVAMVAGAAIGYDRPHMAVQLQPLGAIFLRLIKTIIAPLLFATLVGGIAGHADLKKVGRMGIKAIVYFEIITTLALIIGLAAINISNAGAGVRLPAPSGEILPVQKSTAAETILHIFPENIAKSIAEGQVLQVVVFSILFGMALAMVPEERRRPLLALTDSLAATMFKFTNLVMYLAPFGVGAAIAYAVGSTGIGVLVNLAKLLGTLYAALAVFILCVLLPVALLARVPLKKFIAAVAEPVSIAFGTSSSEAALPRAMEAMEGLGVPRQVVAFVMPTGYSFNLDGSTLYLSLAAIFVAQAAGVHLTLGTSVTTLGYPHADQQRCGRSFACRHRDSARDGGIVWPAGRTSIYSSRNRSPDGYGTHRDQCVGELPGHRGRSTLGRRLRRRGTRSAVPALNCRAKRLKMPVQCAFWTQGNFNY